MRQPVAVAGVKHRAVDHAQREIGRAAASGVEHDVVAGDDAPIVEADAPVGAEIVALAGHHEIVVAIEPDLARPAGHARGERGHGGPGARLAFLAAEAAAHAPGFDGDEGVRDAEDARHDVLRLGRILARGVHRHLVALSRDGERGLALEVEMLLAADRDRPSSLCGAWSIAAAAPPRPKA